MADADIDFRTTSLAELSHSVRAKETGEIGRAHV